MFMMGNWKTDAGKWEGNYYTQNFYRPNVEKKPGILFKSSYWIPVSPEGFTWRMRKVSSG